MKRYLGVIVLVALCVLPAHGTTGPTTAEIQTLTPIDTLPTKEEILNLHPTDPVPRLRELALEPATDFGVRLRAIRALPQFCSNATPTTCQDDTDVAMHPSRAAIREVIAGIAPNDRDGRALLRLRAGIEALGAVKSTKQSDVDLLIPFLSHASRDIRVATARALGSLCLPTAVTPLRNRYDEEPIEQAQVRLAISAALGELAVCSP